MKITISRVVLEESSKVGSEIAQLIQPNFPVFTADQQVAQMVDAAAVLKNIDVEVHADGSITYEINDKLIITVIGLYGKFARVIKAVVETVRIMLPILKKDVEDYYALANERR